MAVSRALSIGGAVTALCGSMLGVWLGMSWSWLGVVGAVLVLTSETVFHEDSGP